MNSENMAQRRERSRKFWTRESVERPLIGFQVGPYLLAHRLSAGKLLLGTERLVTPDMLSPKAFIPSYEELYQMSLQVEQDIFWCAEPYGAIPWMEAMFGCPIVVSDTRFIAQPFVKQIDDLRTIAPDIHGLWSQKYCEFLEILIEASAGRYPIGQPILRGSADILATIIPPQACLDALREHADMIKDFIARATDFFIYFLWKQAELIPEFHDGHALGFFHVWCPERCFWFQNDFSTMLSPEVYEDFFAESNQAISEVFDYNTMHVHLTTLKHIHHLISLEKLRSIGINRDIQGASVKEMLPALKLVQESKPLIIRGIMDKEDIDTALQKLSYRGLYLNQIVETVDQANFWSEYIVRNSNDQYEEAI